LILELFGGQKFYNQDVSEAAFLAGPLGKNFLGSQLSEATSVPELMVTSLPPFNLCFFYYLSLF
jgi:hypothetical protein